MKQDLITDTSFHPKWEFPLGAENTSVVNFDGPICSVVSRFRKSDITGKYHGTIEIFVGIEKVHTIEIEANSIEYLKELIEQYLTGISKSIAFKLYSIKFL